MSVCFNYLFLIFNMYMLLKTTATKVLIRTNDELIAVVAIVTPFQLIAQKRVV